MENNFEIINKGRDVFLSKYLGNEKVVKVPEEIDGNKITGIDTECFKGCKTVEAIIVSNTVETIATNAFKGCNNLKKLVLGTNVKNLEPKALNCLSKLETLYLLSENFDYTEKDFKPLKIKTVIKTKFIPDMIGVSFNNNNHTYRDTKYIISGWDPNYDYENKEVIELENGLAYFLNDKNEAILTRATNPIKTTGEVVVPSEIDGHVVVGVGYEAFYKCEFGYMILPNSIKEIHTASFGRSRFDYLKLPDELNYLGDLFFGSNLSANFYPDNDLPSINDDRVVSMPYAIDKINYLAFSSGVYTIGASKQLLKGIKKSKIGSVTPLDIHFSKEYLTSYYLYKRGNKEEACIFSCNHIENNKIALPSELDGFKVSAIDILALNIFKKKFFTYNSENYLAKNNLADTGEAELSIELFFGLPNLNPDYLYKETDFELTLPDSIKVIKNGYMKGLGQFNYSKEINFKLNNCLEEIDGINFKDPYFLPDTVIKLTNVSGNLKTNRKEDEISVINDNCLCYEPNIDFDCNRFKTNDYFVYEVLESDQKQYISIDSLTPSNNKVIIPSEIDGIQVRTIELFCDEEFTDLYCDGLAPLFTDNYLSEEYNLSNRLEFRIKNAFFDFHAKTIETLKSLTRGVDNVFIQEGLEEIRKYTSTDNDDDDDNNKNTIKMNFKIYFDINHDEILENYENLKKDGREITFEEYIKELSDNYYEDNKRQWSYRTLHLPRSLKYINDLPPVFQKVYISKNTKIDNVIANFIFYDDEGNTDEYDIAYHDGTLKSEFVKK